MSAKCRIYLYGPTNQTPTILVGRIFFFLNKLLKLVSLWWEMSRVHFPTGQHCWDRTEAAGRWRGRSLLLPRILQETVYLRERKSRV